ncbi:MAG: PKD domain-containing protein [Thermoplasmata archaeon]
MGRVDRKIEIVSIAVLTVLASMFGMVLHLNQNVVAGTEVSGHITTDTTWTVSGSPYWIVGDTFVDFNTTLTIEAGVSVLFNGSYYFNVSGFLWTKGSEYGMVVFSNGQPPDPTGQYWEGIVIERTGYLWMSFTSVSHALCGITLTPYRRNISIDNSIIQYNRDCGIALDYDAQVYLYRSQIMSNDVGLDLGTSSGSVIDDSEISYNNKGIIGNYSNVWIQNSRIFNNVFVGVSYGSDWGTKVSYSTYWNNTIFGNGLQNPGGTGSGISLQGAMYDTVGCNVLSENGVGLDFYDSYNINVHHNDFISNLDNAVDDLANYFDDGSEGNYWDDYNGSDSDGDGIGDTPYYIDNNSVDHYPLMHPTGGCGEYNEPPVADANGPYFAKKGWTVDFDGRGSRDPDGSIVDYEWDFGDGSPKEYGVQVSHVYSAAGIYNVTLKVTDNDGASDTDTTYAEIIDGHPAPPRLIDAVLSGPLLEDVELSWELSGDDGAGDDDVDGYNIYRGTAYDPDCSGYGLLATLPLGSDSWVDTAAGHGDPNIYFYCVGAVDDAAQETLAEQQASKFAKLMSSGMVLMSMPLQVSDSSVTTVFQTVSFQRVIYYDAMAGKRHNWRTFDTRKPYSDLQNVDHTMALWVEVLSESHFTVAGLIPQETTIHLVTGWNFVGYPSFIDRTVSGTLAVHYQTVEGFDPMDPPWYLTRLGEGDLMTAGEGYWIHVSEDYDWVLTN